MVRPLLRLSAFILGTLICAAACTHQAPPAPSSPAAKLATPLAVRDGRLVDARGRRVILRGLNHIGLRSNASRPPYHVDGGVTPYAQLFDLQDLEDGDFDRIAGAGFNAVRLVASWEFAQPEPPPAPYDERYFALLGAFLDRAAARGLYVIFDFAQFGWSRAAGGNAGAPDWAIGDDCASLPGPGGNAPPQASARVGCASMDFWSNAIVHGVGLQDAYLDLWREVVRRFGHHPALAIADLYNEPYGALTPPGVFELRDLYPFYRRLAAAIRELAPDLVIGVQPELYSSLGLPTPAAGPLGIDNALYLPHAYTAAYFTQRADPRYLPGQSQVTAADLDRIGLDASVLGTPFLLGETGWTRTTTADGVGGPRPAADPTAPPRFGRDLVALADQRQLGWTWFAYSSTDEAYGVIVDGHEDEALLQAIATPFPRAVAGGVAAMRFDPDAHRASFEFADGADDFEIALPLRWQYPQGACVRLDGIDAAVVAADGRLHAAPGVALAFDPRRATLTGTRAARSVEIVPLLDGCAPAGS